MIQLNSSRSMNEWIAYWVNVYRDWRANEAWALDSDDQIKNEIYALIRGKHGENPECEERISYLKTYLDPIGQITFDLINALEKGDERQALFISEAWLENA